MAFTELDAVNEILGELGLSPVTSLTNPEQVEARMALNKLRAVSRRVQSMGWWFNTYTTQTYQPDTSGVVNLPAEFLAGQVCYLSNHIVQNRQIVDMTTGSNVISIPVTLEKVVMEIPFESLPSEAQNYVLIVAKREYERGSDMNQGKQRELRQDEMLAKMELNAAETRFRVDYAMDPGHPLYGVASKRQARWRI